MKFVPFMQQLDRLIEGLGRRSTELHDAGFVLEPNQMDQARIRASELKADLEQLVARGEDWV